MDDIVATMKVIRTGVGLLIKRDGETLLELQKEGPYAGKWDLPVLKIDCGEKPEETVKRLVDEKLQGSFDKAALLDAWTATFEQPQFILHQIALIYEIDGYKGGVDGFINLSKMPDKDLAPLALNAKLIQ